MGSSIYQGQKAAQGQRRALRQQKDVQARAEVRAISEQRTSEQRQRSLNRRQPDLTSLLGAEEELARRGPASTLLTRGRAKKPTLGQTSLLGGEL